MKKTCIGILVVLMLAVLIVGCSAEPEKTEEELREEIKAEMEAEAAEQAAAEAEAEAEEEKDQAHGEEEDDDHPEVLDLDDNVLHAEDLAVGDEIDGRKIVSFSFEENDKLIFSLEGTYEVKGRVEYSEYTDGYVFSGEPTGEESILHFHIDDDVFEVIPPYSGMTDILDENLERLISAVDGDLEAELMAGNVLNVQMRVADYSFYGKAHTSPFSGFDIEEIHSFSYAHPSMAGSVAPPEESYFLNDGQGFIRYDAGELIQHDLNGDGELELITYDGEAGVLEVEGYDTVDVEGPFLQRAYFLMLEYVDPHDERFSFPVIGVVDDGPSDDPFTELFGLVTAPDGSEWFGRLGSVPGEVVSAEAFALENPEDFSSKAVLRQGAGIEAPVRLDILPQTWWGRTLFIYNPRDMRFKDSSKENQELYVTLLDLTLENDISVYKEKNHEGGTFTMKGGQPVTVVATDNQWWFALEAADGTLGWVDLEDFDERNLSGFSVFD